MRSDRDAARLLILSDLPSPHWPAFTRRLATTTWGRLILQSLKLKGAQVCKPSASRIWPALVVAKPVGVSSI